MNKKYKFRILLLNPEEAAQSNLKQDMWHAHKGIFLLHSNARLHTAAQTQAILDSFILEVLDHLLHSPDLMTSDFYLFRVLKHYLGASRYNDDDKVKTDVNSWLSEQAASFYE